ncbi:MAG: winged helix-turn-helix domain-containing protein [Dokdonella sp.]|uniref:winged helix-turn-helix domain-containing protein n=1 Tax=Dokdonella sp. TaxID=2291710 RepID=UPI003265B647
MATTFLRFGAFRLDPNARELFDGDQRITLPVSTIDCLIYLVRHRDRPIGRDELASAVWGRVDVSEVSLSHAIMRLRRVLGDDGNAQRIIRTVPRLGYRWVMEGTHEDEAPGPDIPAGPPSAALPLREAERVVDTAAKTRHRNRWSLVIAAVVVVALLAAAWRDRPMPPMVRPMAAAPVSEAAMVLPATVAATAEWDWLRLGLMDLVATRLRRGALATMPSESVVALVDAARGGPLDRARLPANVVIEPAVTLADGRWTVRLALRAPGRVLETVAQADDAMTAASAASDELLIKLGHAPSTDSSDSVAVAESTLRQRINAAVLSGQLDVARQLIAVAAPAVRGSPEIALSEAKIDFFAGEYERSLRNTEQLLANLAPDSAGALRARALNTRGAAAYRLGRIDDADRAYAEAIRLATSANEPDVLAKSYIGSGGVASQRLQLERAAADYGRARTLLDAGNDAFGVAAVDLNLGIIAMQRGQMATAEPLLQSASARFGKFGAEDALGASLVALVDVQLALLDHAGAVATATRIAPLEEHGGNRRQRWELTLARASAFAAAGRLSDADILLSRALDASDRIKDAVVRAQANALAADIALMRGDAAKAAELAGLALAPELESRNRETYASAWLTRVRALQRSRSLADARVELARMRSWSDAAPQPFDHLRVVLAEADQAIAEGPSMGAFALYADAMRLATARGIPEETVLVGEPYVQHLIDAGRIDEAVSVNGRVAPWADRDARSALTGARIYTALGRVPAADAALRTARTLAGERPLAPVVPH